LTDIFISYSSSDAVVAEKFASAFAAEGLDVWWDNALQAGEVFDEEIERALRAAKAVVVLWSPNSVASRWVRAEATIADRRKTFVPATISPCERPIVFELTQTPDLSGWNGSRDDPQWRAFLAKVRGLVDVRDAPEPLAGADKAEEEIDESKPSILILPFVNMSGDAEQEYFSDGVSEDIITDLNKVSALTVVSRNTAFSLKGKTLAAADLAEKLGVTHILEGSVRRSGDRVRITAQLFDAESDNQVWAERYDRTLEDIFAIQDEISQAIVKALQLRLAPSEKRAIAQRDTTSSEAYELFLLCRNFMRKGSGRNGKLVWRIAQRAVELDPGFARAWAMLSQSEGGMAQTGTPGCSYDQAQEWAEKAVELGPEIAECHAAVASNLYRRGAAENDNVRKYAERAVELDPNCFEAYYVLGNLELRERKYADAVKAYEKAIALDPKDFVATNMVLQAYRGLQDWDNLRAASRRLLTRAEAILESEPDHGNALALMIFTLIELEEGQRARTWIQRALLFNPGDVRLRYNLACAGALLGDIDFTLDTLEYLADDPEHDFLDLVETDSDFDMVREDPRFVELLARAGKRKATA